MFRSETRLEEIDAAENALLDILWISIYAPTDHVDMSLNL